LLELPFDVGDLLSKGLFALLELAGLILCDVVRFGSLIVALCSDALTVVVAAAVCCIVLGRQGSEEFPHLVGPALGEGAAEGVEGLFGLVVEKPPAVHVIIMHVAGLTALRANTIISMIGLRTPGPAVGLRRFVDGFTSAAEANADRAGLRPALAAGLVAAP